MTATDYFIDKVKQDTLNFLVSKTNFGALGDGSTPFNASNTQLENELLRQSLESITLIGNILTVILRITTVDLNNDTLSEVGVFEENTSGLMVSRDTFPNYLKANNKEVRYTLEYEVETVEV